MLIPILLFALGLVLLIKGGDWFVDGATGIAHKFHIPELLIGATVVSIGTTLPEVMVSATSAVSGHGEIAYGNAIGSIICNTALIAALTIAIRPPRVERKTFLTPVIFFFFAAVVYMIVAYGLGTFSRPVGFGLLAIFVVYMVVLVRQALRNPEKASPEGDGDSSPEGGSSSQGGGNPGKGDSFIKDVVLLAIGAVLIAFGANLLVENGTLIAQGLGVPESVIALTFVALGTSLPELVTAITSLVKGHGALSLGNIIGANLFNLVLVSGVSVALSPFAVPNSKQFQGMNASLVIEIPVMMFVMLFLTVPALVRGKLSRVQGIVLLAVYAAFCAFQFIG